MEQNLYRNSDNPVADIQKVSYAGQPENMRRYQPGFERFMEAMPILRSGDPFVGTKTYYAGSVMKQLAAALREEITLFPIAEPNTFQRTIIGLEPPSVVLPEDMTEADAIVAQWSGNPPGKLKEGAEIIVAHWGAGFSSPVHGHAPGYHYEDILTGKIVAHSYRQVDVASNVVRPAGSQIVGPGTFVTAFEEPVPGNPFERPLMIHNFIAVEPTQSLHFLPEHSRDGKDNGFTVEYFEDVHHLDIKDLEPSNTTDAYYAPVGTVFLVRSINVPEYGDHFIVIVGPPVQKPHGMRPQDHVYPAPHAARLLDQWDWQKNMGLSLLKLRPQAQKNFLSFHDIVQGSNGKLTFPTVH